MWQQNSSLSLSVTLSLSLSLFILQVVKIVPGGVPLRRVFISSGFAGRAKPFPGLNASTAAWDEVCV